MIGLSSCPSPSFPSLTASRCCGAIGAAPTPVELRLQHGKHSAEISLLRLGRGSNGRSSFLRCRSSGGSHQSSSGDNDSKAVLDAFFLGKAFAEALNERIVSAVGEVLSVFGQWQAEQQKQAQDFQEEVIERARRSKQKAALEAMEKQSIISKSLTEPPMSDAHNDHPSSGPTTENPLTEIMKD